MDLKDFYFQNIQESEYHYRFYGAIKNVNRVYNIFDGYTEVDDCAFEVFDAEEAITKFRELCEPNEDFSSNENKCWFYLVTYYLYKTGYEITGFPRLLARPPVDPNEFYLWGYKKQNYYPRRRFQWHSSVCNKKNLCCRIDL